MRRSDGSDILAAISGGLPDVATGGGLFIVYVRKCLKDYPPSRNRPALEHEPAV